MRASDPSPMERFSSLVDVMHLLTPPAWKIVSLIARDDLLRQAEAADPVRLITRDMSENLGIDFDQQTEPEKRSGLELVRDPYIWTRLSLAQICHGVVDGAKRKRENRALDWPRALSSRQSTKPFGWGF